MESLRLPWPHRKSQSHINNINKQTTGVVIPKSTYTLVVKCFCSFTRNSPKHGHPVLSAILITPVQGSPMFLFKNHTGRSGEMTRQPGMHTI